MILIKKWQYKYIEKCLYSKAGIFKSELCTEKLMAIAIAQAEEYFRNSYHYVMIREYYYNADTQRKIMSPIEHFYLVCDEIAITPATGYLVKRDIIYRIAMNCFALGVFKL